MLKKTFSLFVLAAVLALFSGCGTIKGIGKGAAEGAKEDWTALKKADKWMRENLW